MQCNFKYNLEEIIRLRAEGERILEEEQAKYKHSKKVKEMKVRIKLKWNRNKYNYKQIDIQKFLGANLVVMSTKNLGTAVAEFER